jgi:hypothetical protein
VAASATMQRIASASLKPNLIQCDFGATKDAISGSKMSARVLLVRTFQHGMTEYSYGLLLSIVDRGHKGAG